MCSIPSSPDPDLTAAARIRNAALRRFARDGFGVGLRAIAADAGVTAGLITHHFGPVPHPPADAGWPPCRP